MNKKEITGILLSKELTKDIRLDEIEALAFAVRDEIMKLSARIKIAQMKPTQREGSGIME